MLSVKDLRTLEVGDVVEAGTLFAGMTREPLKLEVTKAVSLFIPEAPEFELGFRGTYFGVFVGTWTVAVTGDKAVWTRDTAEPETPALETVS